MISDPHYRAIIERLKSRLDPNLFERCVCDLLRDEMPTLVPISGGSDAGMDGAIAEGEGPAYPLVCTTAEDVIGNLTKSLASYVNNRGRRRHVVLVTSQDLTPRRRRHLEERAREKGFELVQIYPQEAVADRLYRNAFWCNELLALTGNPSALSVVPLTSRPLLSDNLIGREADTQWLRETEGDRLLLGAPGSGKTFLLRRMAAEGQGLFLASSDSAAIANAIREQDPEAIFVDDAHTEPERVAELSRLREQVGAGFDIVATAWSGAENDVIQAMILPQNRVHKLGLLTRNEIVQVINESGVSGPTELVKEIVDQAEGRPGLAVSLAYLCLQGGVEEVVHGDALKHSTMVDFEKLVGKEATYILAAFAVGGDAGLGTPAVAEALQMRRPEVSSAVNGLAAGGVIDRARQAPAWLEFKRETQATAGDSPLSVRPISLRYALVRDVFFASLDPLPINELLAAAPSDVEVALTLVRTSGFGASVPSQMLIDALERAQSTEAWKEYASLGEPEARWVLENHPELTLEVAGTALERAPVATIPRLLEMAVDDHRPLNSHPDHPVRRLGSWIQQAVPGRGRAVPRRTLTVNALEAWISSGANTRVVGQVLEEAISPAFNDLTADPGMGTTVTMRRGRLAQDELSQLEALWPRVVQMLSLLEHPPWKSLFEIIRDWTYPSLHGPEPPAEIITQMQNLASRMVLDVIELAADHPGVLREASERAQKQGWELEVQIDPEYEVLFPADDLQANYAERQEAQKSAVLDLAREWSKHAADEVAARIARLEAAAKDVDHTYPRYTPLLCEKLAEHAGDALAQARALVETGASAELIAPFLLKAATLNESGWEDVATECLERPAQAGAAVRAVVTTSDPPEELLSRTLNLARRFANVIESLCRRGEVPRATIERLLEHEEQDVAVAAAVGAWYADPSGEVGEDLAVKWRSAILKASSDRHMIQGIVESDSTLAHDWLLERVEEDVMGGFDHLDPAVENAISVLDRAQRLSVLRSISESTMHHSLVAALVEDDLDLYSEFLADEELRDIHLWPLRGKPEGGVWIEKAKLALEAGFAAESVAAAVYGGGLSWGGSESSMWRGWAEQFRKLLEHEDEGIREVGRVGAEYVEEKERCALESERQEAIYGR